MEANFDRPVFLLNPNCLSKEVLMASYEAASCGFVILVSDKMYLSSIPAPENHEIGWELLVYKFIGIQLKSTSSEN